jgi:D-alanyl-D-alanine carboxypeptidase
MKTGIKVLIFVLIVFGGFRIGDAFLSSGKSSATAFDLEDPYEASVLGSTDSTSEKPKGNIPTMEQLVSTTETVIPERTSESYDLVVPRAHASVILDVDSGTILHFDEGKEQRQIASLTKMLTALIVMEETDLEDVVTITQEGRSVEGTVVGCPRSGYCIDTRLQVGETITVRSLMKALLINSANDAAHSLAIHIDGSVSKFAERMNRRAEEMGLRDSHFCTPSGLEIEGMSCYSSAYDIARIAIETLQYEEIWKLINEPTGTVIASTDGMYTHELLNTNALLGEYPGLVGTKTGFTPDAGYSLLAVAKNPKNAHRVVAVVLDDPYRWDDIKNMFDWAFSSHKWK